MPEPTAVFVLGRPLKYSNEHAIKGRRFFLKNISLIAASLYLFPLTVACGTPMHRKISAFQGKKRENFSLSSSGILLMPITNERHAHTQKRYIFRRPGLLKVHEAADINLAPEKKYRCTDTI
jgi:hypothetical protein